MGLCGGQKIVSTASKVCWYFGEILSLERRKRNISIVNSFCCSSAIYKEPKIFESPQKWLVSNTLYTKNRAEDTGGGVYVSAWLHITVSNSTFLSNSARGQGGALGAEVST